MVNLRYHIVSLIAVFLALAVGVVLGAGPLQNQVKALSDGSNLQERARDMEADLEQARRLEDEYSTYVGALTGQILPGTLSGNDVVTVSLPGVDPADLEAVQDAVARAGGSVVGSVQLTENWISTGQREYRETLSAPLSTHLAEPSDAYEADEVLSQALVEVLNSTGAEVDLMREILSDETNPLITLGSLPSGTANSAILIGPRELPPSAGDNAAEAEAGSVSGPALLALADALASLPKGAVAVGSAQSEDDLITQLRAAETSIATVDQLGTAMGTANAIFALADHSSGQFGQGEGASEPTAPLPNRR